MLLSKPCHLLLTLESGPLWSTPTSCMDMAAYQTHQAGRMWSRSCWGLVDWPRWVCSWVPCMPSSWEKFFKGLGQSTSVYKVKYMICWILSLLLMIYRWIYALILTINTNFCLKLKEKCYADNPPLGDGWSHFVTQAPFEDYVGKWGWQVKVSNTSLSRSITCTNMVYSWTCMIPTSLLLINIQELNHICSKWCGWGSLWVPYTHEEKWNGWLAQRWAVSHFIYYRLEPSTDYHLGLLTWTS